MQVHPRLPVSLKTRRRWQKHGRLPAIAALAMRLLTGDLGEISPAWTGWVLEGDVLHAPNGDRWDPRFLQAWAYERQLLNELRRQLANPQQYRLL